MSAPIPRGCRRTEDGLVCEFRPTGLPSGWVLLLFLAWFIGILCVPAVQIARGNLVPEPFSGLFAAACWMLIVVLTGVWFHILLYRSKLTLTREGLEFRTSGLWFRKIFVPFQDLGEFRVHTTEDHDGQKFRTLELVRKDGKVVNLPRLFDLGELDGLWLITTANALLGKKRQLAPESEWEHAAQPEASEWRLSGSCPPFEIERVPRRLSLFARLHRLFACVFWNGIVTLFQLGLWGVIPMGFSPVFSAEWWVLFAFLLPFVVGGVLIGAAALHALFPALVRERWTFTRDEFRFRRTFCGLGHSWSVSPRDIESLEITEQNGDYAISLLDENAAPCGILKPLTAPDACWLAGACRQIAGRQITFHWKVMVL